jgi:hypothetical protein
LGTQLAELDLLAQPLLRVRQQDRERVAIGVFEVDADGVAAVAHAHVGDDGACADRVSFVGERTEARGGDIGRAWTVVAGVRLGRHHLGLAVGADGRRVRVELAPGGQLLLREAERDVEQPVEVGLRFR